MVRLECPVYYILPYRTDFTCPPLPPGLRKNVVQKRLLVSHLLLRRLLHWITGRRLLPSTACGSQLES